LVFYFKTGVRLTARKYYWIKQQKLLQQILIYPMSYIRKLLERPARCYRAMTCSPAMGSKVGDILQILGGGLIP
jgi:hypothetical protein